MAFCKGGNPGGVFENQLEKDFRWVLIYLSAAYSTLEECVN